ncbi:response regulator transcription factor [Paenibacillus polymyxa]|uniref:winged helix-turn-helix domain-containing protein n=1 Tax=Paenibacillus polymyxa TaxID=1406 RepID=UPI001BECE6A1|nr:response regulator transcription factor [Paenibacillus polymyxa]MBT2285624.1 response regulator transcription factor [Paenibacillus polymyxa]
MRTAILLIGAGEQVSLIQDILCNEGYEVQRMEWSELNQSIEPSLLHINLIILVDREEGTKHCGQDQKLALKRWINKYKVIPLLVITSDASPQFIVEWLDYGANDVMEEPIHLTVMLARIRNLLRVFANATPEGEEVIVVHDLKVNLRSRRVNRAGEYLTLTPKEYELLEFLALHVNEACTRSDILREVWGYEYAMDTNVVDVYIKHLRVKVDKGRSVKLIHTVRGIGYMLHDKN